MLKKIGWVMFFLAGLIVVYMRWWSSYSSAHTRTESVIKGVILIERPNFPIGFTRYQFSWEEQGKNIIMIRESIIIRHPLGKNWVIDAVNGRVTDVWVDGGLNLFGDSHLRYVYLYPSNNDDYDDYVYFEKAIKLAEEVWKRFRPLAIQVIESKNQKRWPWLRLQSPIRLPLSISGKSNDYNGFEFR